LALPVQNKDPAIRPIGASTKLSKPAYVGLIAGLARQTIGEMALPRKAQ
jgi:hypothetical protein